MVYNSDMKIAFVIDSSAGMTKKETNKLGWYFIPLLLTIDDKEYKDGIDITSEEYYKMININMSVKTSASTPASIITMMEKLTKEYDHVIFYPLSMGLSSQVNNITSFSKDFDNVHVIQSVSVGHAIVSDIKILESMVKDGNSIEEIVAKGNALSVQQYGFAVPAEMDWLIKGGRVSPGVAQMAKMLKIVPIISFTEDGKLDKFGKGRSFRKTITKATKTIKEQLKDKDVQWSIYDGGNPELASHKKDIEDVLGIKLETFWFPPIIGNHIGPGVIALMSHGKK